MSPAPLTLANGNDTITVEALWDPGSESSFFASHLLPFSVDRRDQSFKIETLTPSARTAEVVHWVDAAFDVPIPGGGDDHSAPAPTYGDGTQRSETEK